VNRRVIALSLLILVVLPLVTVQACGPEFYPDVFVRKMRPDNPKEFAAGKLGILLQTYPRADLIVAYRYLNGGKLTSTEQAGYSPTETYYSEEEMNANWQREEEKSKSDVSPAMQWQKAREQYAEQKDAPQQMREKSTPGNDGGTVYENRYADCGDDALTNAVKVLQERAETWGAKSPELQDWIAGQDAVFSSCNGANVALQGDVPNSAVWLLHQDRAYQKAAALFYQEQYDAAILAFQEIGRDQQSPWRGIARYVATRAMVRKAFMSARPAGGEGMATFDLPMMMQAQSAIESLLKETASDIPRHALQKELNLVRLRTEPKVQLHFLSAALVGPKADSDFSQHLTDLTWYLNAKLDNRAVREDADVESIVGMDQAAHGATPTPKQRIEQFSKTYRDLADLRSASTLVDWLITFQSPADEARMHAISEWKRTGRLSWLVAALCKASARDAEAGELVKAAELVPTDAPAGETVNFHRIRLLTGLGRSAEARALLDQAMPRVQNEKRDSSLNLYQGLRMRSAASLDEALTYAPRKILNRASEEQLSLDECLDVMKNPRRKYDCRKDAWNSEFDPDAASLFNLESPLNVITDAAVSNKLPDNLRRALAAMAWVRSVLTNDEASAAKVFPLLPQSIQEQAGPGTGFKPLVTLVRNPGLRPYLDPGVQRSYSFDFVESYRDNWWCKDWGLSWWENSWQQRGFPNQALIRADDTAAFLSPAQKAEGEKQSSQLRSMEDADVVLGQRIIAYAKDHPDDPSVPESLFLVLRMVRYSCGSDSYTDSPEQKHMMQLEEDVRRTASRILRQRYAASPWTKKAAPFAG